MLDHSSGRNKAKSDLNYVKSGKQDAHFTFRPTTTERGITISVMNPESTQEITNTRLIHSYNTHSLTGFEDDLNSEDTRHGNLDQSVFYEEPCIFIARANTGKLP